MEKQTDWNSKYVLPDWSSKHVLPQNIVCEHKIDTSTNIAGVDSLRSSEVEFH